MKCVVIYQRDTYKYSVDIIFCNSYAYSNLLWAKDYIVISDYIYKKKLLYEFENIKVMVRTFPMDLETRKLWRWLSCGIRNKKVFYVCM